jgi:hypothetical protein
MSRLRSLGLLLLWLLFKPALSSPNGNPFPSDVHAPMHATSWGEWDVDATAEMAFVAAVLVVVRVAQAGEVIRETARGRSNAVVLGRRRHEWRRWSLVLESGWVERRGTENVHWSRVLSGVCCWLPAAQVCGGWARESGPFQQGRLRVDVAVCCIHGGHGGIRDWRVAAAGGAWAAAVVEVGAVDSGFR